MHKASRFIAALLLFAALPAHAQWQLDGALVSTASSLQQVAAIASDGSGGAIIAWHGYTGANTPVYAQRVDPAGVALWTTSLTAIAQGRDPQVVSDGSGGAVIAWVDFRGGIPNAQADIYAQRIDASGAVQWGPDGVAISAAVYDQDAPTIVADGSGGAIITWRDFRTVPSGRNIYAQWVNGSGSVQWTVNGVALCTAADEQISPTIVPDGSGGAIVTWQDYRSGTNDDIYARRINALGVVQWFGDGVALCTVGADQRDPMIASDGSGGAIVTWWDWRNPGNEDIYAQRVNGSGVTQWTNGGIAVCADASSQGYPRIVSDGSGGAVVVWRDHRNGVGIFSQRVNASGVAQWAANGVELCTTAYGQAEPVIVSDGSGGGIVAWEDQRGGTADIYTQWVHSNGAAEWTASGVALCTAASDQLRPAIISDGSGGAIVTWVDHRYGYGASDIYAQRVGSDGKPFSFTVNTTAEDYVTGTLWEAITQANATPGPQVIRFDIPGPGPHTVQALCLPFPAITDELTIDGFTQPGASPNANPVGSASNAVIKIEISGPSFFWGYGWKGLEFQAPGTLRGIAISGFDACVTVESPDVIIEGNYIGTNASGLQFGPHQQYYGVHILSDHCRVGGSSPAARNVICNAFLAGIRLDGAAYTGIYGDYVGVGADGTADYMPNATGIQILSDATGARIGASTLGTSLNSSEGNIIMWNNYGVVMDGPGSVRNQIIGNSFLGNWYGTIDLGNDGLNPNDAGDVDSGPNGLQNSPDLSSAAGSTISGTMTGAPNVQLYLHFYWSPGCCLNATHYVGGTMITMNGSGSTPFTLSPAGPIPPAAVINATATDTDGNTSEISFPIGYSNTASGSSQTATLMNSNGTIYGTATFSNVTSTGNTYTTNPYSPPTPVSGFSIGNPNDPQIYYNVTTDASYTGGVDICLNYDENNIPDSEANLVLLHYDGSTWVNVTTSRDLVNNTICGHVTSLSPFVIGAVTTTDVDGAPAPSSFALHPNVPNPFNPTTTIRYDLPVGGADVNISVYDVAGRHVRTLVDEHQSAGVFSVQWNGDDDHGERVASGVYFYRMRAGEFVETRKMVLLK